MRPRGPVCGHRSCDETRAIGRRFCDACWAYVPHLLRAAIARATERRDVRALTDALGDACREITRRRAEHRPVPDRPRVDPRTVYALTAARMGEHDEVEAAE